jgi:hypothetical protein
MSGVRTLGIKDAFGGLKGVFPNCRRIDFVPDRAVERDGPTRPIKIEIDRFLLDQPVPKLGRCGRKRVPPPKELCPKGIFLVAHWNFRGRVPKGGGRGGSITKSTVYIYSASLVPFIEPFRMTWSSAPVIFQDNID